MLTCLQVKCEDQHQPLGVDCLHPKFSFIIHSQQESVLLVKYRIQVSKNNNFLESINWDTGLVSSSQSVNIPYQGERLKPHTRYYYRVKIWDNNGNESDWSKTTFFETAFLDGAEWEADYIGIDDHYETRGESPCILMRKEFNLSATVKSAKLYVSAKGLYHIRLNGEKIGDDYFTPGFTNYHHKLQYQSYDITSKLSQGTHAVGFIVGDGWYKGYINWNQQRNFFGYKRSVIMEIHITYTNGKHEKILSDEHFKWMHAPIEVSEFYHGEKYDAREEQTGFDLAGFNDEHFYPVKILNYKKSKLVAQQNESVKVVKKLKPKAIIHTPNNETVLDMGQLMVGQLRIHVSGKQGDKVVLKHGEVLDRDGNFYFDNIGNDSVGAAKQEIHYTLKGGEQETYQPHFTYQCFRYVHIIEFPGTPSLDNFSGLVLSSFHEQAGSFECSNALVNQLQQNILWTQRGNFIDIPIAGPQRAERLGWTGDAQMFAETACYNMDTKRFYRKWLDDLQYEQHSNGSVPLLVPNVVKKEDFENPHMDDFGEFPSSAAWGDAALIIPWLLYVHYGDEEILRTQYSSMKKYVEYMRTSGDEEYLYNTGFHYGDWFSLDGEEGDFFGKTPKEYIATAFYAYSTSILAKTANVLANGKDQKEYEYLYDQIIQSFTEKYVDHNGSLNIQTQSACVLALQFNLVKDKRKVSEDLVRYIRTNHDHLTTGFVTTPYLLDALSENGQLETAYNLLLQTDCPSWLYQVNLGATTIWEHWDSIKPDGSFWSPWMNSFNHTAFGCIGKWFYAAIAGIKPDENHAGYKHFYIQPQPGGNLTYAKARVNTNYGDIFSSWEVNEGTMQLSFTVPPNTKATILFPASGNDTTAKSIQQQMKKSCLLDSKKENEYYKAVVGSGQYQINYCI